MPGRKSSRPRIAVIGIKGLPAFGGSARTMESIIEELSADFDFVLYVMKSHVNEKHSSERFEQIPLHSPGHGIAKTFVYYIRAAIRCLHDGQYDLVHVHHGSAGFIVPLLRTRYGVVTTLHGVYTSGRRADKFGRCARLGFRVAQRLALAFSNVIVCVSEHELPFCRSRTSRPVVRIPNGVDTDPEVTERGIGESAFALFAAARIIPAKGCHLFLRAAAQVGVERRILIVGDMSHDSRHAAELRQLAEHLDVRFVGLVREKMLLMKYFQEAKYFVFPSLAEGMSNVLLEAASMECPIICSDIAANLDALGAEHVISFDSGKVSSLASALEDAERAGPRLRYDARLLARRIREQYAWNKIAEEYRRIYLATLR